ncbi:hypothetical protein QE152_g22469 [Popillia japonica]|uniref:Periodic tryptophan protein 1 n=1 Tax=Popillia japonica TaxID=7064 RepID=A0AAW1KKT9_POPJA
MDIENESKINFIPCIRWVKQGVAKSNPEKVQLTKDELVQIINETKSKLQIAEAEESTSGDNATMAVDDEFKLENYDDDEDNDDNALGIASLAELPTDVEQNFSDSDDSEKEDEKLKSDDNLILAGRVDGDASTLEIYVYNETEGSLYVHHDFLLPAFPLCIEWLDHEPGHAPGNYCAIGTMDPIIDIWDLDIINCLEPAYSLASGSVDTTIILWDIDRGEPNVTIRSFVDKVQCLEWHRLESQTLLAGGCDKSVRSFDCRTPETHLTWPIQGEAERASWNPLQPYNFFVGTSEGIVQYFDIRKGELWSIKAHEQEVSGLVVSGQCPGLLVTTSGDGTVKTWDFKDDVQPELVYEKDFKMGNVHCMDLCPNHPFTIAAGGDKKSNNFTVLDLFSVDVVKHRFGSRQLVELVAEQGSKS